MTSNAIVERDPLPVETGIATAKGIPSHRGEPYGPKGPTPSAICSPRCRADGNMEGIVIRS